MVTLKKADRIAGTLAAVPHEEGGAIANAGFQQRAINTTALDKLALLPLELRRPDGALVKQLVLRNLLQTPDVDPGDYNAIVEPWPGVRISQRITVKQDGTVDLQRLAKSLATSTLETGIVFFTFIKRVWNTYRSVADALSKFTGAEPGTLVFVGTPFGREPVTKLPKGGTTSTREGDETRIAPAVTGRLIVQLPHRENEIPLNVTLIAGASLLFRTAGEEPSQLPRIEYGHPIVDRLVALRQRSQYSARDAVLSDMTLGEANEVITSSPAAALRLAYALLASASANTPPAGNNTSIIDLVLDKLDDASSDTHAIRAERLASAGRYSKAFEATLTSTHLGLPAFSFGLDFITRRLSTYAMIARSKEPRSPEKRPVFWLARERSDEINRALDLLQPFANVCDFAIALTAWRSNDPTVIPGYNEAEGSLPILH